MENISTLENSSSLVSITLKENKLKKDGTFVVKSFAYEATMAFKKIQEEYSKKGVKTSGS